jgi:hypothetical protein
LERDQALHRDEAARQEIQRLTIANRNGERILIHVLHQRNEAWFEEDVLRARQVELEQQLANAEEYHDNLHEEVHQLHNQLHPFVPPGAAEMEPGVIVVDDDMEAEEDPEMEEDESTDEDGNVSEMDSDHDE